MASPTDTGGRLPSNSTEGTQRSRSASRTRGNSRSPRGNEQVLSSSLIRAASTGGKRTLLTSDRRANDDAIATNQNERIRQEQQTSERIQMDRAAATARAKAVAAAAERQHQQQVESMQH